MEQYKNAAKRQSWVIVLALSNIGTLSIAVVLKVCVMMPWSVARHLKGCCGLPSDLQGDHSISL